MRISDWSSDVCSSDLLKAGAHPCQNATTHREKRLRGAGFDAPPRALHGTEIIGFAQRAKGGGVSPPLRRQPDRPRFALAASTTATTCGATHSPRSMLRMPGPSSPRADERRGGKEGVRTW